MAMENTAEGMKKTLEEIAKLGLFQHGNYKDGRQRPPDRSRGSADHKPSDSGGKSKGIAGRPEKRNQDQRQELIQQIRHRRRRAAHAGAVSAHGPARNENRAKNDRASQQPR